jgi:hypothetical protein
MDIIIGDNEKGTCRLIDVAIFWESVILAFSVKGIKFYPINSGSFVQLLQNEKFKLILLELLLFAQL